jgi:hypothetical protein
VITRAGHIRLPTSDGGKLIVELLQDGFVGIDAIEEILGLEIPLQHSGVSYFHFGCALGIKVKLRRSRDMESIRRKQSPGDEPEYKENLNLR